MSVYSGVRPSTLLESSRILDEVDFSDIKPYDGSILELTVQCEQNDMNMFESVIELDFLEAAQLLEADGDGSDSSDAAEKSIWEKLKDLLRKAWESIKSFIGAVINKITSLIGNDAKLVAQYEKYFKAENLKGFKIKGYRPIKMYFDEAGAKTDIEDFTKMVEAAKGLIEKSDTTDSIAKDYFGEKIKSIKGDKSWKEYVLDTGLGDKESEEKEFLSYGNGEVTAVLEVMKDGKKVISILKSDAKKAQRLFKYDARMEKAGKKGKKDLDLARANAYYKLYNSAAKEVSKYVNARVSVMNMTISNARKAFIAGGKYAKAKAEGKKAEQTTAEMAADWMLGVASDAYVESVIYGY